MLLSRRDVLKGAAAAALTGCAGRGGLSLMDDGYGGFNMGIQTYSLRKFDLDGVLARMNQLGLKYAEVDSPSHMPVTADAAKIATYKEKLEKSGIAMHSYFIPAPTKDHEKNKESFEFAKAMGIKVLVGDPKPDSFESLDRLTREYGIKIAIHNHGPKSRYDKIADVQKAIEKWPEAIGTCVDTGHYIRTGEDPAKAIRAFGSRVHDAHLKDALDEKTMTILGKGKMDVVDVLRALREVKFSGVLALEYEENPENPMEDIKECLAAVREGVKKL